MKRKPQLPQLPWPYPGLVRLLDQYEGAILETEREHILTITGRMVEYYKADEKDRVRWDHQTTTARVKAWLCTTPIPAEPRIHISRLLDGLAFKAEKCKIGNI